MREKPHRTPKSITERHTVDGAAQRLFVAGKVFLQRHCPIETDDHRKIVAAQRGVQERDGCRSLVPKHTSHARTLVDEHPDRQWQLVFTAEAVDFLLEALLFYSEIVLFESGNESSCAVCYGEGNVDEVDIHSQGSLGQKRKGRNDC